LKTVEVPAFWIDKTEVTVDQYGKCVQVGSCENPGSGGDCNWNKVGRGTHPINCVNWDQANKYCEWAGKRLPTEHEWEKAARGTDGGTYPWGNSEVSSANPVVNICDANCYVFPGAVGMRKLAYYDDGYAATAPVGSYPAGASPFGSLDMAGNVSEWLAGHSDSRRVGGGSWSDHVDLARASLRGGFPTTYRGAHIGFRCAK
jgi:formylglycine-generating enzyme required for sulfatase activity